MAKKQDTTRRRTSPLQVWTLGIILLLIVGQFVSASLVSFFWKDSGLDPIEEADDSMSEFAELEINSVARAGGASLEFDEFESTSGEDEVAVFDPDRVSNIDRTPTRIEQMIAEEQARERKLAALDSPTVKQITSIEQILQGMGADPAVASAASSTDSLASRVDSRIEWPDTAIASATRDASGRASFSIPSITQGRPLSIRIPENTPGAPSAPAVDPNPSVADRKPAGSSVAGGGGSSLSYESEAHRLESYLYRRMEDARNAARAGQKGLAEGIYWEVQGRYPAYFETYALLAQSMEERGDLFGALDQWNRWLDVSKNHKSIDEDPQRSSVLMDMAVKSRNRIQQILNGPSTRNVVAAREPVPASRPTEIASVAPVSPPRYIEAAPIPIEPEPRVLTTPSDITSSVASVPREPTRPLPELAATTRPTRALRNNRDEVPPSPLPPSRVRPLPDPEPAVAATPPRSVPSTVAASTSPLPPPRSAPAAASKQSAVLEIISADEGVRLGADKDFEEIRRIPIVIGPRPGRFLNTANVTVKYAFFDRDTTTGQYVESRAEPVRLNFGTMPNEKEITIYLGYYVKVGSRFMQARFGRALDFGGYYAEVYYNGVLQDTVIRPPNLVGHTNKKPPRLKTAINPQ